MSLKVVICEAYNEKMKRTETHNQHFTVQKAPKWNDLSLDNSSNEINWIGNLVLFYYDDTTNNLGIHNIEAYYRTTDTLKIL